MAREIERKFLVKDDSFITLAEYRKDMRQGYLTAENSNGTSFRVRIADDKAFLTVKGRPAGISRAEFEYPLPLEDAEEMLKNFCEDRIIDKTRYYLHHKGFLWEVDVFHRRHAGLIVAEIELDDENVVFEKPDFVGEEVTDRFEYSNFYLSMH